MIVAYVGYRALKKWMIGNTAVRPNRTVNGQKDVQIDDIMVQDPYCRIHFPKREGVRVEKDGREYYFCSEECRDKYFQEHLQD
jgi:YHS domain-containing protein